MYRRPFQLAQSTSGYLTDVRAAKHPFQLAAVLNIVHEIATSTMSRKDVASPSWSDVSESILQLVQDGSAVLPVALEAESVVKGLSLFIQLMIRAHVDQ